MPLRSLPPVAGPPETTITNLSLRPDVPLSVTDAVKVQTAPLDTHKPLMVAVRPEITSDDILRLRTLVLVAKS